MESWAFKVWERKLPDGVLNWENSSFCWGAGEAADGKIDFAFGLFFPTGIGVGFFVTTARMLSCQNRKINYVSSITGWESWRQPSNWPSSLFRPSPHCQHRPCSSSFWPAVQVLFTLTNEKCCSFNMCSFRVLILLSPPSNSSKNTQYMTLHTSTTSTIFLGEYFFWGIWSLTRPFTEESPFEDKWSLFCNAGFHFGHFQFKSKSLGLSHWPIE